MFDQTKQAFLNELKPLVGLYNFLESGCKPSELEIVEVYRDEVTFGYFLNNIYYGLIPHVEPEIGHHFEKRGILKQKPNLERNGYLQEEQFFCFTGDFKESRLVGELSKTKNKIVIQEESEEAKSKFSVNLRRH